MADFEATQAQLDALAAGGGEAAQAMAALRGELEALNETGVKQRQAVQAQINDLRTLINTEQKRADMGAQAAAAIQEQIRLLGELKAQVFSLNDAYDVQRQRIRGLMGINESWKSSTVGVMAKIIAEGKGVTAAFAAITTEMQGAVSRSEMFTSSVMKMQELSGGALAGITKQTYDVGIAMDQAQVSLARTTGASREYAQMIVSIEGDLNTFGVTMEQAGRAVGSLYSGMSSFTQLAPSTRQEVASSVAFLQTMGIAAEDSARNLEIMTRSMGLTGTQAANLNQQMFTAAQELGISTTKMLGDFGSIGPQLIKFGQEATRVYINLQSVAKNTGIEISRLLSITEQFDRFDSAAESVGRLNAILGGPYLNTIQMVTTTDPTERLQMMAAAVKDAGMTFDSMSYYMRQATASAMGLQDVNELAMIMRGRMDLLGSSTNRSAADIEKMMQETQRYNSVADEMRQVMRQMAIAFEPFIGYLKSALNFLQEYPGSIQAVVAAMATMRIFASVTTLIAAYTTALAAAKVATLGFTGVIVGGGLIAALAAISSQNEGLQQTANAVGQIGATINAIPERKTIAFKAVLDAGGDNPQLANMNAAVIAGTANAMYRSPPPRQQTPLEVKVNLEMDGMRIGSQVVETMLG
mgnify:FL=1